MPFLDYAKAGFTADLLPILPPDATISASSKHPEHVRQSRGKVPGRKTPDGWVGFGRWTEHTASDNDVAKWETWGAGIGLQGREFVGLDNDVSDAQLADRIELEATLLLGFAPVRFGRGSRRLSPYRLAGAAKRRLAFTLPARADGADAGASDDALRDEAGERQDVGPRGDTQAVELLGVGQQYLLEGIHPKTGEPYRWRGDVSPATLGTEGLTEISVDQLDDFFASIERIIVDEYGGTIVTSSHASLNRSSSVTDESHYAPSLDAVLWALAAVPNDVDYDTWLKVGVAVKAACGEAGYDIFEDWSLAWDDNTPEGIRDKWDSFKPPFKIGWPWLSTFAGEHGFHGAQHDFGTGPTPDAEPAGAAPDDGEAERQRAKASGDMFQRMVFVEGLEAAFDLASLRLKSKMQFNAQWWTVGDPSNTGKSAWASFMRAGAQRRDVISVTYRPSGPLFVDEPEIGMCVNIWRKPKTWLPASVTDDEIRPWLDHLAYLVPDERERKILLDWLAWVVQHPELKPNFGLLVGSQHHGVGKSIMLEPVRYLLGNRNVREIGPEEVQSGYTGWLAETKLLIVEEMHSFDRKTTMNRLKSFVAAPPWTLYVNPKYGKPFEVPNLLAAVFFTNHYDALALELNDRRFFVLWADVAVRPDEYYRELVRWFHEGGNALAGRWLMNRDVSGFNAQGRAPATTAKEDMRKMTRTMVDEWIEEGMEQGHAPFNVDIVTVKDIWDAIPDNVVRGGPRPTQHRIGATIARAGGVNLGRPTLHGERVTAYALRNAKRYTSLSLEMLAARIIRMRSDPGKEGAAHA